MYTLMGCILADYSASTTDGYSHSLPDPCFAVNPLIRLAARWWNPPRTLIISPATTHLFMPYKSTYCANVLYIYPRVRTIAPVLSITLATIPPLLRAFLRFWYTAAHSL